MPEPEPVAALLASARLEKRHRWEPTEPIPSGWTRGNQCFDRDDEGVLWVFVYDPKVPYAERTTDGSTDRWIKHVKVNEQRQVTEWEVVP